MYYETKQTHNNIFLITLTILWHQKKQTNNWKDETKKIQEKNNKYHKKKKKKFLKKNKTINMIKKTKTD